MEINRKEGKLKNENYSGKVKFSQFLKILIQ